MHWDPVSVATIVGPATPWGRSSIAVVRLSGPGTLEILRQVCGISAPRPRVARLVELADQAGAFDQGMVTWFPGPSSYTGEDVAEVSCHGNPLLVERLLAACVSAGARPAERGEFTRRAYLNGRMDLTRAEAVLQAIEARSLRGVEVAFSGLHGGLARELEEVRGALTSAAAAMEAWLDFPDEQLVDPLSERLEEVRGRVLSLAATFQPGRVKVFGARVALVGPVNVGKSSLFNALLGRQRALVSPTPGTTRDVLEAELTMGCLPVTLLDTAGDNSDPDPLEADGLALRDALLEEVDLVILVLPAPSLDRVLLESFLRLHARPGPLVVVANQVDRGVRSPELVDERGMILTNALNGAGLPELEVAVRSALAGEEPGDSGLVIASQRQRELLGRVAGHVGVAQEALDGPSGVAVAAAELTEGLACLDDLDGRDTRESVLDALFRRFCVGK